jgi:hypothetical protein
MDAVLDWLLASPEPWTRYRTFLDLKDVPTSAPEVAEAREALVAHPKVGELMDAVRAWGDQPFKRHNDAAYPIYKLSTLADFGLRASDAGMSEILEKVLAHQSAEGAFQTLVNIPVSFGGSGQNAWTWIICDAPTLLYALLSFGLAVDPRVQKAVAHLVGLEAENGWRCVCTPELGKFHGPGKKTDPCPIANVYALKALSLAPELIDSPAAHAGVEMLLSHWDDASHSKPYLFGAGSDYHKLKYPFVWYDILHVADVLRRFPVACRDPRFQQMVAVITAQADTDGRYTASSMYQSWKGWSFSDKKNSSPWLTFLVLRIQRQMQGNSTSYSG